MVTELVEVSRITRFILIANFIIQPRKLGFIRYSGRLLSKKAARATAHIF
jgi:hypothetical protein